MKDSRKSGHQEKLIFVLTWYSDILMV